MKLDISLGRAGGTYAPGEAVDGVVLVTEGGRARSLTARLALREVTPGYRIAVRTVDGDVLATGALTAGQSYPFRVTLPADALPTLAAPHSALIWAVEATADRPGPDARAQTALIVPPAPGSATGPVAEGRQSRRRRNPLAGGVGMVLLFALIFVVLGAYGVASPGVAPRWVFVAVFGGMAAVCVLVAVVLFLRRRPRVAHDLHITGTSEVARGGVVEGELTVTGPTQTPARLGLVCIERYDVPEERYNAESGSYTERVTHEAAAHEEWLDLAPGETGRRYRFTVPADAPFSHQGDAVSWVWQVVAREARDRRRDAEAVHEVWVRP